MIKVTFPDGSVREYAQGVTGLQIAESISPRLAQEVLAVGVNGETRDLMRPIDEDASVKLYKWDDEEGKHAYWHSSAHLMAEALQELYPGIKFGIGPAIENGFYYDVDPGDGVQIKESDLPAIEARMQELAARKEPIVRSDISKADALKMFADRGDEYKVELINDLADGTITLYTQGAFTDLCRGPHLPNTGLIKAVKLTSVAGAYWRGDESRKMLTRIYGITFPKKKMLDEYLALLEEAKKRDHRRIGKELELFMFSDTVGKGLPMWLPRGTALRLRLEDFLKKIQRRFEYQQVMTPHIGNKQLYVTSGHYAKYGKDSFQPIHTPEEGEEYLLKPMNCPHHCEIYKFKPRSYKDLPLRFAEFGTVYRYEQSGELHGLTRVRSFTQDDAHIFCRPDQLKEEFLKVMDIIFIIFKALDFDNFEAQILLARPGQPRKVHRFGRKLGTCRTGHRRSLRGKGAEGQSGVGRGRLLWPEARLHGEGCHRPPLAVGHDSGGLQPARTLQTGIHRRGQPEAPSGDDPPRTLRLHGALLRRAHRAHRRPLPPVAHARPGGRAAHQRTVQRLRLPGGQATVRPGHPRDGGRPQRKNWPQDT